MIKGRIADIQRASLHDGPGIRTTVFLKGCPLHCAWCHNPECISFESETLFYADKCIGCGQCDKGCFSGARVLCGKDMEPEEVMREILEDRAFYGGNGGVTFSGGEPLAQPEFLREMLDLCHAEHLHTAVETSMYRFDAALLSRCNLIMTDVKIWNRERHIQYTGADNAPILENIRQADSLNIPMILRTPVICGVNDTPEEISTISEFARSLVNAVQYELLPYHPLGLVKSQALGREQMRFERPNASRMEELNRYAFIR